MAFDWMIVGLGNPGGQYALNRHNIGFMVIDSLVDETVNFKSKSNAHIADVTINDQRVLLVKPTTYMNNSGEAVGTLAKFYKIPTNKIAVIYDELDLAPAQFRIKQAGGHGGHNGIKSLDSHLPDKNYWRLRCGIGHPGHKHQVNSYVLSNFAKSEIESWLPDFLSTICDTLPLFLEGAPDKMMTRVAEAMKN